MDDHRFDSLTRMLASGVSRRTLLRSFLGLGGAIAVSDQVDARTARTRPTIPPPQPPACPLPKQMCGGVCCDQGKCKNGHCCPNSTDVWCGWACCASGLCTGAGDCCAAGEKVCGSTCCPDTTSCAIDGNHDICCDPASAFPCGLECCTVEHQCCDRECCAEDHLCLASVFGETGGIEGEICCLASQTCDGRCCDGNCFFDPGSDPFFPLPPFPTRTCCPVGDGTAFCPGIGDWAPFGACCSGDTPNCCHDDAGRPVCISDQQCCTTEDCIDSDDICCDGECVEVECCISDDCDPCEICDATLRSCIADPACTTTTTAAPPTTTTPAPPHICPCEICEQCNTATNLCEPLCGANQTCCFDVCFDGAGQRCCFSDNDCPGDCEECRMGAQQTVGVCVYPCSGTEHCCANSFTSRCASTDEVCCTGDPDCRSIPTYCEQHEDDLHWHYYLCSGSVCTLTAHVCDLAQNICERDICGETTGCDVEPIPPGGLATDGVGICCDSHDDCDGLPRFCDDDDRFHYWLCGAYTCQATARQCDPGRCNITLGGCEIAAPGG